MLVPGCRCKEPGSLGSCYAPPTLPAKTRLLLTASLQRLVLILWFAETGRQQTLHVPELLWQQMGLRPGSLRSTWWLEFADLIDSEKSGSSKSLIRRKGLRCLFHLHRRIDNSCSETTRCEATSMVTAWCRIVADKTGGVRATDTNFFESCCQLRAKVSR
jgi:hypothetical protein